MVFITIAQRGVPGCPTLPLEVLPHRVSHALPRTKRIWCKVFFMDVSSDGYLFGELGLPRIFVAKKKAICMFWDESLRSTFV